MLGGCRFRAMLPGSLEAWKPGSLEAPAGARYMAHPLAHAAPQVRKPHDGDLVFVGADELLVGEVANHLVDALTRGPHHRRELALRQSQLDADAWQRPNAVDLRQLQELLGDTTMYVEEEQVLDHGICLAQPP